MCDREVFRCRFCSEQVDASDADPSNPCPGCDKLGWYVLDTVTSDVDDSEGVLDHTPMQERILAELEGVGEASATELKLILETGSGIYTNLRELRDAGEVTARDDPEDGRRTLYSLPEYDTGETYALDHTDTEDLQRAYEDADGVVSTAADRFEVGYGAVYKRMVDAGIHEPASQADDGVNEDTECESDENPGAASSTSTCTGEESEDAATEELEADESADVQEASDVDQTTEDAQEADTDADAEDSNSRQCGCGHVCEDGLEYAIHRTEEHGSPQSVLGYLEPGEFESVVEGADSVLEMGTELGWSTERVIRALNIYGLAEIVGPSDVELSDITDVDVLEEVDPATVPDQDSVEGAVDELEDATVDESDGALPEDGEALSFTDYSADPASVNSAECQGCGSHVHQDLVRVLEPDEETAPRCCPNCEDLIRDGNSVRKKRA